MAKESSHGGQLEYLHISPTSRRWRRKRTAWGCNWATLSLGDINTETWSVKEMLLRNPKK
jgi:hypothetical protein